MSLLIQGGTCVTPSGTAPADILVDNGRIQAIGDLWDAQPDEFLEADGLHILPGVIDSQVHFREPGLEHKEDLESGTRSAILGGVTTVFEMPNTKPETITPEALNDKLQRAEGRAWSDHAFFVGGTTEEDTDWAALECLPGTPGIKIFLGSSTGDLLVDDDAALRRILSTTRRRCPVHCEDEGRMRERKHLAEEAGHPRAHPIWRDDVAALMATRRLLRLAMETGHPVQVLHVTTHQEIALLARHKDIATVEVTPQHLTLTDEAYERIGSRAQMNPPVRSSEHQEALWKGVTNGTVDVLGSDHAPHTLDEKSRPYPQSPSGMPGVQTMLPLMLNHVHEGRLTLERLVDLTAHGPQRVYNIANKGRIAVGYDADLVLVDLKKEVELTDEMMASKSGWTPFAGMSVTGFPVATVLRGQTVMRDGAVLGEPQGRPAQFIDTLRAAK